MTADNLRKLQRRHERYASTSAAVTSERNAGIYEALREGKTHEWIAEVTGLSRGLISKFAKRLKEERTRTVAHPRGKAQPSVEFVDDD